MIDFEDYTKEELLEEYKDFCPGVLELESLSQDKCKGQESESQCKKCWDEALEDIVFKDTKRTYTSYMQAVDEHEDACTTIAMEECSELIKEVSKAKRGKLDRDHMAEEMADVLISIDWLMEIYDIDYTEVMKWKDKKENRVVERLNSGDFN